MNKLITYIFSILLLLNISSCESELSSPDTSGLFMKLIGTPEDNFARDIIENDKGGFMLIGSTVDDFFIQGADVDLQEVMLIEIDKDGNTNWLKILARGVGRSIKKTEDNGYIIVGNAPELDEDDNTTGYNNFLLIKTDELGDTLWTKVYGETERDEDALNIDILPDEGYILTGNIIDDDGNSTEMWIVKTDFEGNLLFEKEYGFSNRNNEINETIVLDNKDIISCGTITQADDMTATDVRVVLVNDLGLVKWDNIIQLPGSQTGKDIIKVGNGFIIIGTDSDNSEGSKDIFLAQINNFGEVEWTNTIGTENDEGGNALYLAKDGLILTGVIRKTDKENDDILLVKTNFQGEEQWTNAFGGDFDEEGQAVIQNAQNDFIILSDIRFERNWMLTLIKVNEQGKLNR